jgi:pyruvate,water dikinase
MTHAEIWQRGSDAHELLIHPADVAADQDLSQLLGGKAASLCRLSRQGFAVPEFCCLPASALEFTLRENGHTEKASLLGKPHAMNVDVAALREAIQACVLPEPLRERMRTFLATYPDDYFAVRSSATLEDGAENSFAGLFLTRLNVRTLDDISDAIKDCWAALLDEKVIAYLAHRVGASGIGLGLVVQRLVPAEKSGVLFSIDPLRGLDTEVLIEACFGLGEALVSGHVTPDRYRYDWHQERETERAVADKEFQCVRLPAAPFTQLSPLPAEQSQAPVLAGDEVRELAALGMRIHQQAGTAVDVEWARCGDTFYVLQSRPVTRMGFAGIPGQWSTANFRDGGVSAKVCTPYMASLTKYVFDAAMTNYLARLGLPVRNAREEWLRVFYSRPYWNMDAVKFYLQKIPGYNERAFDDSNGVVPNYVGDGFVTRLTPATLIAGLRALFAIKRSCRKKLREAPAFVKGQLARLDELAAYRLVDMPDGELFRFCADFLRDEYFRNELAYFDFVFDNSNLNSLFKEYLAKFDFDPNEFPGLLGGLVGVSHLKAVEALWDLAHVIRADATALAYWSGAEAAAIAADHAAGNHQHELDGLSRFLSDYGHHATQELDLSVPRYAEDTAYVIAQIKEVLAKLPEQDPRMRNSRQALAAEQAQQALLVRLPFWTRRTARKKLQEVRQFLWWREELRDLSTKYYFHVRRLTLTVAERLVKAGMLADANDVFFLTLDDLLQLLEGKSPATQTMAIVYRNRRYYDCYAGFTNPDEAGEKFGPAGAGTVAAEGRMGVVGSPGKAVGVARVIRDINDAWRLQAGDILVTRCTDPGWTSKFSLLGGVVTETGGILSHAAVICREYGIPAILAVKRATSLIRDGETIEIDGATGIISVQTGTKRTSLEERTLIAASPAPAEALA